MTIRFRCCHCQQLMAIASAQIGKDVDCPMCGRGIRVPAEDGAVSLPVSKRSINLGDESLASALNEVAAISEAVPYESAADLTTDSSHSNKESSAVVSQAIEPTQDRPIQSLEPVKPTVVSPEDKPVALEELAPLVREGRRAERRLKQPPATAGFPWLSSTFVVVAFLAGLFCGKLTWDKSAQPVVSESDQQDRPAVVQAPNAKPASLQGRITYQATIGETRPDAGARVFVFPVDFSGQPIRTEGLLNAPIDEAFLDFSKRVQVANSFVAIVDSEGNYQIDVPVGRYRVLVLSRFQSRAEDDELSEGLSTSLRSWFDRGAQVLGKRAYKFDVFHYRGEGVETRDYLLE